ncbi:MAG: PEP-utilizing enzyme [Actinomycetota bacterium]|uniref:PEP-utilising enzyme mobile domain-containing protein n=1 Tax=marine metagenome TaxID=408172 RepID=A0A381QI51_9ZZZZ|nr:PEP-utilizing enzyme [Actinomycetota bacterium]MEC9315886.1 PEP-utilizing enzyme [Actinomycetota bacterium]MED5552948.1 PEP-utilizing enzyme [Actinomycetota bacterium]MEE3187961.1 PEP-utilizing enzyme [Actinomycetota bacterium]|tara:strand:- start:1261 stop:3012 length:1752 start_codon:yes stop_codon:yes gene_type:complete
MAEEYFAGTKTSDRYPIWTRANVGEVFPDPVALSTFDFAFHNEDGIQMSEQGFRDAYIRIGAFEESEFDPDNPVFLGVFGGYTYLNASLMRIFGERAPGLSAQDIDDAFFGVQPGIPPYEQHPDDVSPEAEARIGEVFGWALTTPDLPEVLAQEQEANALRDSRPDFASMGDHELVEWVEDFFRDGFQELFAQHIFISFLTTVPLGIVSAVCEAVGRPTDAMKIMAGLGDVESAAPSMAMWELGRHAASSTSVSAAFETGIEGLDARLRASSELECGEFVGAFDQFLRSYGSRGPNEWEMSCPTWETDPDLALAAIDRMRVSPASAAPQGHQADLAADRERLVAEIGAMLEADPEAQGQFLAGAHGASVLMPGRERTKTNCVKFIQEARMAAREFGRRMVERGIFPDVCSFAMLRFSEQHEAIDNPEGWRELIEERQAIFDTASSRQEPFVIVGEAAPLSSWDRRDAITAEPVSNGDSIQGMPGCPGVSEGRARIILDSHDPTALEPGDVLIAPLTDPSWTPLFVPAAGVVVDVGAALSHAIIVSRELGIPCVVSATDATKRIPDGAMIRVDGDTGVVTVLEA